MHQCNVESFAGLVPVADGATGAGLVTLTEPVEGWEPGTYRARAYGAFSTGPAEVYAAWLRRLDGYSAEFREMTQHGLQPFTLGPTACALLRSALAGVWRHDVENEEKSPSLLTDLWLEAVERGANQGLVRVR